MRCRRRLLCPREWVSGSNEARGSARRKSPAQCAPEIQRVPGTAAPACSQEGSRIREANPGQRHGVPRHGVPREYSEPRAQPARPTAVRARDRRRRFPAAAPSARQIQRDPRGTTCLHHVPCLTCHTDPARAGIESSVFSSGWSEATKSVAVRDTDSGTECRGDPAIPGPNRPDLLPYGLETLLHHVPDGSSQGGGLVLCLFEWVVGSDEVRGCARH
jgi:hypothetical protein